MLLEEASIVIDSIASEAAYDSKKLVSCRMVRRAIGNGCDAYMAPIGSTQGLDLSSGLRSELGAVQRVCRGAVPIKDREATAGDRKSHRGVQSRGRTGNAR